MYEDTYKAVHAILDINLRLNASTPHLAGMTINEMLGASNTLAKSSLYNALAEDDEAGIYGIVRTNTNRRNKRWTTKDNPMVNPDAVSVANNTSTVYENLPIEALEGIPRITDVRMKWMPHYETNYEMFNDFCQHIFNGSELKGK